MICTINYLEDKSGFLTGENMKIHLTTYSHIQDDCKTIKIDHFGTHIPRIGETILYGGSAYLVVNVGYELTSDDTNILIFAEKDVTGKNSNRISNHAFGLIY